MVELGREFFDEFWDLPLSVAVSSGDLNLVKWLLDKGFRADYSCCGSSPLGSAIAETDDDEILFELLRHLPDDYWDRKDSERPFELSEPCLHSLVRQGRLLAGRKLVESGYYAGTISNYEEQNAVELGVELGIGTKLWLEEKLGLLKGGERELGKREKRLAAKGEIGEPKGKGKTTAQDYRSGLWCGNDKAPRK